MKQATKERKQQLKAKRLERRQYLTQLKVELKERVVAEFKAKLEGGTDEEVAREEALQSLEYGLAKIQKIKDIKGHKHLAQRRELAKQGLLPPKPVRTAGRGASWQQPKERPVVVKEGPSKGQRRRERLEAEAAIPAFLTENGWTQSEVDPGVWSRPNWEQPDGECVRTLKQAYRIQYALTALQQAA